MFFIALYDYFRFFDCKNTNLLYNSHRNTFHSNAKMFQRNVAWVNKLSQATLEVTSVKLQHSLHRSPCG